MALKALRKQLYDVDNALANGMPAEDVRPILADAVGILDEIIRKEKLPAASQLGRLGGAATAKRGPDYFRELAARRKTHGGGRPRKDVE